nr:GxxExxY protein [Pedobacter borealis]
MTENEIAKLIVNAAYQVHVELGPGLLESAYEACLVYELVNAGLQVSNQIDLPVYYKNVKLNCNTELIF